MLDMAAARVAHHNVYCDCERLKYVDKYKKKKKIKNKLRQNKSSLEAPKQTEAAANKVALSLAR